MTLCNRLHRHFKGHNIICSSQSVHVFQINLMLGRSQLMVRRLHSKPHLLQIQNNITAYILCHIYRAHIKIPGHFPGVCRGSAALICVKQEKFTFRAHMEGVSHSLSLFQNLLQHIPGIALKRFPVGTVNVTNQAGNLSLLRPPGEYLKGIIIRIQIHIRFLNPNKSVYGRAVKYALIIQRPFQLTGGKSHVLQHTKHIPTVILHCFLLPSSLKGLFPKGRHPFNVKEGAHKAIFTTAIMQHPRSIR